MVYYLLAYLLAHTHLSILILGTLANIITSRKLMVTGLFRHFSEWKERIFRYDRGQNVLYIESNTKKYELKMNNLLVKDHPYHTAQPTTDGTYLLLLLLLLTYSYWLTLTDSLIYLLTQSLTYTLTQSITYTIIYTLIYLLTYLLTYSLTYLLTYSLTYALTLALQVQVHAPRVIVYY